MTMKLLDSFEIQESKRLLKELTQEWRNIQAPSVESEALEPTGTSLPPSSPPAPESPQPSVSVEDVRHGDGTMVYRADRLEDTLRMMCRRGGFQGAIVTDETGLTLAVFNSPEKHAEPNPHCSSILSSLTTR